LYLHERDILCNYCSFNTPGTTDRDEVTKYHVMMNPNCPYLTYKRWGLEYQDPDKVPEHYTTGFVNIETRSRKKRVEILKEVHKYWLWSQNKGFDLPGNQVVTPPTAHNAAHPHCHHRKLDPFCLVCITRMERRLKHYRMRDEAERLKTFTGERWSWRTWCEALATRGFYAKESHAECNFCGVRMPDNAHKAKFAYNIDWTQYEYIFIHKINNGQECPMEADNFE